MQLLKIPSLFAQPHFRQGVPLPELIYITFCTVKKDLRKGIMAGYIHV